MKADRGGGNVQRQQETVACWHTVAWNVIFWDNRLVAGVIGIGMAVTRDEVEKLDSKGWSQLPDDHKDALLEDAKAERRTIFGGNVSSLRTIEGDEDVFVKNLAAHKWELAEGGEASSESSAGGSVNYNLGNPSDTMTYLSQTRFGRTCIALLGNRSGAGIVRSY